MAQACTARYRARNPRATPLYRLFETHFDEVRGQWEERFERRYGFWRGFVDEQVGRYLDCGLFESGFARVRCPDCGEGYLLAFSCKTLNGRMVPGTCLCVCIPEYQRPATPSALRIGPLLFCRREIFINL